MLTYLRLPLRVALWMVALMSGILSLVRELYGIYSGAVPPRSVFWSCVWVAFILSALISWVVEHKEKRDLQKVLGVALAGPKFTGHFYQFQIFPRTGIADPDFINQALNLAHGRDALDKSQPHKCDYDVFVEMYVQNDTPGKGSIIEYVFEMEFDRKFVTLERQFNFRGWILERKESLMDARNYLTIVEKRTQKAIPDLAEVASGVLEQGKGAEGWLHYVLRDVAYTEFDGTRKRDMRLTVNDGKGGGHIINQSWTGEPRPWRVGHDFSA